jgi:cohesin complex subunit SA-1/2
MNLDVFRELRQSTAYSSLLDDIIRQFLTHSDEGVLKEASKTLRHAKTFEDLQEVTDTKLGQLKDETITALANSVRGKDLATASFSEASMTELINTVRRLEYISGIVDCVEMFELPAAAASAHDKAEIEPINVLLDLLHRGANEEELEDELTLRTLKTLAYYFMWRIRSVNSALQELDDTDIDDIIDRWSQATDRIVNILTERGEVDDVKLAAGSTFLDLTTLFITATEVPRLVSLAQPLGEHVQDQLMSVLDGVEKAYAKSCGKKVEPADDAEPEDVDSDEEDEEADQSTQLRLEQRLCEFTGKIVVAALAKIVDPKKWRKRLVRNHAKLGPNFREVVNYLDRASVGRPGTRRGPQKKPPAAVPPPKSAETVEDEDEEVEQQDQEEEDGVPEEEEEHHEERDENEGDNGSDPESEPDPEVEVPPAGEDDDEEMQDA